MQARFPDLVATAQAGRDREYYLRARALPTGLRLKHAFFRGEVSLVIERRWAERVAALDPLPEGTWAVAHGGERHVRRAVEVLDPALPLAAQEEVAVAALEAARSLVPFGLRLTA